MGCSGNDAEDNHALGYPRIDHHGTESLIIFTKILGHLGRLGDTAVDVNRSDAGLSLSDIDAALSEAVLDCMGDGPAFSAELVTVRSINNLHALDISEHKCHRQRLGVHL